MRSPSCRTLHVLPARSSKSPARSGACTAERPAWRSPARKRRSRWRRRRSIPLSGAAPPRPSTPSTTGFEFEIGVRLLGKSRGHGVWVPAFAGTTTWVGSTGASRCSRIKPKLQFGFPLGIGLVPGGIFLRIRPAGFYFVIVVQHRPRRRLLLFGRHVDHEPALPGVLPDIRFGRIGLAQLGVIADSR